MNTNRFWNRFGDRTRSVANGWRVFSSYASILQTLPVKIPEIWVNSKLLTFAYV